VQKPDVAPEIARTVGARINFLLSDFKSNVGPLAIELLDEGIAALLLLDGIHDRRPRGMLVQGGVHTLVASILLGMSGFDAFGGDAEP
jgi:hypothetical protein